MGLVSHSSLGNDYVKSYSNNTQEKLDAEVRLIVDTCYNEMHELLESKKDLIAALAEELLSKETLNLSQIIKILGPHPFPLKESVKKYLGELEERLEEDAAKEAEKEAAKAAEPEEMVDPAAEAAVEEEKPEKKE